MARAKSGVSDAVSLALRIATVVLSVTSAAMMASATQPATATATAGAAPATTITVSYRDYSSFRYSLAATVISAGLQAAAAVLAVVGRSDDAKAAKALGELVDTAAQVLLYSSSALSFAVDDFGSCGRRVAGVCKFAGEFCRRVRASGAVSMAAAVALSVSLYLKDVPISVSWEGEEEHKSERPGCHRSRRCHR